MSEALRRLTLVTPGRPYLSSYRDALLRGWEPDNLRGQQSTADHLALIEADTEAFLGLLEDPLGQGPPIRLPDGSTIPRLPSITRWLWDGTFAGNISLRWQPGSSELPANVLGHIGFSVVPWKRRRGYAKWALSRMIDEAWSRGLAHVELTTGIDNFASQKVLQACRASLIDQFERDAAYGGGAALRYRIRPK